MNESFITYPPPSFQGRAILKSQSGDFDETSHSGCVLMKSVMQWQLENTKGFIQVDLVDDWIDRWMDLREWLKMDRWMDDF